MEQQKALTLLSRQLKDILAQANKILEGNDSPNALETIARYSLELKSFIHEYIQDQQVQQITHALPTINYKRSQVQLWQYIILPSWWISIYKDYQARKKTLEEVSNLRGKYSTLQLIVNSLID